MAPPSWALLWGKEMCPQPPGSFYSNEGLGSCPPLDKTPRPLRAPNPRWRKGQSVGAVCTHTSPYGDQQDPRKNEHGDWPLWWEGLDKDPAHPTYLSQRTLGELLGRACGQGRHPVRAQRRVGGAGKSFWGLSSHDQEHLKD